VLRYAEPQQATASNRDKDRVLPYPINPNGSEANIAGICDPTGRVFGLMPHPERYVVSTQHPQWTRRPDQSEGDGLAIFRNAVRYFS
jgi:phosphoribosylformylglycinamidine synthase